VAVVLCTGTASGQPRDCLPLTPTGTQGGALLPNALMNVRFGGTAAAIPGVIIALAQGPEIALRALAVYVAVQFIEGHLVIPLAQKWAVQMPPALALTAIVAAGIVFGLAGVLFALPLAVVITVLVRELYADRIK